MPPRDTHSAALKALGHPARVELLQLMAQPKRFPDNLVDPVAVGVCVNDLAKVAGLPQSTTSTHLTVLARAGLLNITQHGQWRYARPNREALDQLGNFLAQLGLATVPPRT